MAKDKARRRYKKTGVEPATEKGLRLVEKTEMSPSNQILHYLYRVTGSPQLSRIANKVSLDAGLVRALLANMQEDDLVAHIGGDRWCFVAWPEGEIEEPQSAREILKDIGKYIRRVQIEDGLNAGTQISELYRSFGKTHKAKKSAVKELVEELLEEGAIYRVKLGGRKSKWRYFHGKQTEDHQLEIQVHKLLGYAFNVKSSGFTLNEIAEEFVLTYVLDNQRYYGKLVGVRSMDIIQRFELAGFDREVGAGAIRRLKRAGAIYSTGRTKGTRLFSPE